MIQTSSVGNVLQGDIEDWLFLQQADGGAEEELNRGFFAVT
ncbi:MAG: hypothetical protein RIR88_516 [Actinomycetota bacterium]|jgi:hypothetical protein